MYNFHFQEFEENLKAGKIKNHDDNEDDDIKAVRKQVKSRYKRKKHFVMKTKNQKPKSLSKTERRKLDKRQKKLAQKRVKAVEHMVRQVTAASGVPRNSLFSPAYDMRADKTHGFEVSLISQKSKPSIVAKASVNSVIVERAFAVKKKRKTNESTKKTNKKKCFDVSDLDLKSSKGSETASGEKNGNAPQDAMVEKQPMKKGNNSVRENLQKLGKGEDMIDSQTKIDESHQQSDKSKTEQQIEKPMNKSKLKVITDITVEQQSIQPSKGAKEKNIGMNKSEAVKQMNQSPRPPKTEFPCDEPLGNGGYEIFVRRRKQITKSKKKKINPIKVSCA